MTAQPTLATERLVLRPFETGDAPAERWIARLPEAYARVTEEVFAVTRRASHELVGSIG